MKTLLGFVTGILVGAIGFTAMLLVAEDSDKLIRVCKDYTGME